MNTIYRNPNERGSAILLVLGFLSLLLMMAMIFAVTSRNAQTVADAKADETNAQLQARSAATQAQETVFFLQNKGNIIGSVNTNLQNCLPGNADIEQSPSELNDDIKEFFYGDDGSVNTDHLGLQPYVGYTTDLLPTSWRFLAFYGELSKDSFATTPFGIAFPDVTKVNPYQSIYYSHATEAAASDFDEVEYQGENSLYEIVKATQLGNLYFEATGGDGGQFEKLLKDNKATQLQFRNFFEVDPEDSTKKHIFSRQGFILFNEGSKFDVNRLVSPKMAGSAGGASILPYLPFVGGEGNADELGTLTIGEPGDGLNINLAPGRSTYAIMGRNYGDDPIADETYTSTHLYTDIYESLTAQYGLHPAELQTRIQSDKTVYEDALERKNADKPPRWFSYGHMLSDDANTNLINSVKEDIFTLGIESGLDDRELRFNGQYASMAELLDSIGELEDSDGDGVDDKLVMTDDDKIKTLNDTNDCSYLAKVNIAYPWGVYCSGRKTSCSTFGCANPTWDKIGEKLSAVTTKDKLQDYAKHFFNEHLGLKYDPDNAVIGERVYLFQKDAEAVEAKKDKTLEVFANLTDFCDSDYAVTYLATQEGSSTRITMNSDNLAIAPQKSSIEANHMVEPTFCSNERVPVVVGVNVSMEGNDDTLSVIKNERKSFNVNGGGGYGGGDKVTVYRTSLTGDMKITPRVTLSLQNFFNEKLDVADQKYRVIIQGKILPFLLEKKVTLDHSKEYSWGGTTHSVTTKYGNAVLFPKPVLLGTPGITAYDIVVNQTNANSAVYGLESGAQNTNVINYLNSDSNYWNFCVDTTSSQISRDFNPLENQSIEIECDELAISLNGVYTNNQSTTGYFGHEWGGLPDSINDLSTGTTNYYYCTGMGYAVKIEKIEVLIQNEENLSTEICELAYMEADTSVTSLACASKGDESYTDGTMNNVSTFKANLSNLATIDGATCSEPRMNHLSDSWTWFVDHSQKSESSYFGNGYSAYSYGNAIGVVYNGLIDREGNGALWRQGTFAKVSLKTVSDALKNKDNTSRDWEPYFEPGTMTASLKGTSPNQYYASTMDTTISTYYIPNTPISSLWQLGAIHRGVEGQTINLKKYGTNSGTITHKYADGDAWILDYLKLNELDPNHAIRGKFNPNCFNAGAYRYLFANIPANERAVETMIYANGFYNPEETAYDDSPTSNTVNKSVQRNTYFRDFIGGTAPAAYVNLEQDVFRFLEVGSGKDYAAVTDILAAQSWSPVQAFFNFVEIDGGTESSSVRTGTTPTTYQCNDRQAESLIGCTAGLLSTRYEVFTAIAVGQSVKFLMSEAEMNEIGSETSEERKAFLKQCANPIRISFKQGTDNFYEWYSILSTQVREVTFVRDCWFGKITVLKSRLL